MQDFHGFSEPSWDRKSSQDTTRQGKQGKTRLRQGKTRQGKTKARQDCTLVAKDSPGDLFVRPCGEMGGVYPTLRGLTPRGLELAVPQRVAPTFCAFFAILLPFFFTSFFRCLFASILGRFCLPTCLPKSTKIDEKSMPRCLPMLTSFFDRFLIDFYSQLGPPEPSKCRFFLRKNKVFFKKSLFANDTNF